MQASSLGAIAKKFCHLRVRDGCIPYGVHTRYRYDWPGLFLALALFPESAAKGFFQRQAVAIYHDFDMMWNSWPPTLTVASWSPTSSCGGLLRLLKEGCWSGLLFKRLLFEILFGEHEMQPFRLFVLVGRLNLKLWWNANTLPSNPFFISLVFVALHNVLNVSSAVSRSAEEY